MDDLLLFPAEIVLYNRLYHSLYYLSLSMMAEVLNVEF